MTNNYLTEIPFEDIRNSSPVALVEKHKEKALSLINASRDAFGLASWLASHVALPVGDYLSEKWMSKTNNPYFDEVKNYQQILGVKGIIALNNCYEWGCTSGGYETSEGVVLTRILDWPFPALGENMVVAHQRGSGGDFYNVTWPAVSGVFNALAPERFAAALNQAPMRRHKNGIIIDWLKNRPIFFRQSALPPARLLRKVFETAKSYSEAKEMLTTEPVSIPVIYTLTGTNKGEACVIEKLEDRSAIRELQGDRVFTANHFETHLNGIGYGWLPRAIDSYGRYNGAKAQHLHEIDDNFSWFKPPIVNKLSRLAMVANASTGKLKVIGTNGVTPVTKVSSL